MFLGVVQEGRHVVVQIGLETVDQVPASTQSRTLKTDDSRQHQDQQERLPFRAGPQQVVKTFLQRQ